MQQRHIVLAGDSVFDNDGYVPGEPGVIEQLRRALPAGWSATKVAVDGDRAHDVAHQLRHLPAGATNLIISVGGNDALAHSHLLAKIVEPGDLAELIEEPLTIFRGSYGRMQSAALKSGAAVHVCTIYTAIPFVDPIWRKYAPVAIAAFNDVIVAEAESRGVPVLRLDRVCTEAEDFSEMSPIEPSARGGQKIVDHILSQLQSD